MTPLHIPARERHTLRVFTLDMTPAEVARLHLPPDPDAIPALSRLGPEGLALLGTSDLDPAHVEVFDVADLADLGVATYLIEGNGVAEAAIAADRPRLDALTGPVLILSARAFGGREATLHLDTRLTLIGTYTEEAPSVRFDPLPTPSAEGILATAPGKPPPSSARVSGMVATIVLLFLFLFTIVFVWIA